jgi:hypothetical protein
MFKVEATNTAATNTAATNTGWNNPVRGLIHKANIAIS